MKQSTIPRVEQVRAWLSWLLNGVNVWGFGFGAGVLIMCMGGRIQHHAWGYAIIDFGISMGMLYLARRNYLAKTEGF